MNPVALDSGFAAADFEEFVHRLPVGVYRTSPPGDILFVNSTLVDMLGFESVAQLRQRNLEKEGFAAPQARRTFRELVEKQGVITDFSTDWVRRDGSIVHVRETARVVCDPGGHVLFYEGVADQPACSKHVEPSPRLTEMMSRTIMAVAHDAIVAVNPNGEIVDLNPAAELMFGYRRSQLLGRPMFELIAPQHFRHRHETAFASFAAGDPTKLVGRRLQLTAQRADGSEFPVEVFFATLPKPQLMFLGFIHDLSERRALEQLRAEHREIAARWSAARGSTQSTKRLLAEIGHEVRTPLTGMLGMLDLLLDTPLAAEQKGLAQTAKHSAEALLTLLNTLLDLSKLEAGKMALQRQPFHLPELLLNVYAHMKLEAQAKELEAILELGDLPTHVVGDPVRLRQVLLNLTNNAIKFTRQGWIKLKAKVQSDEKTQTRVLFAVADSGVGISKQAQSAIFEPFVQADQPELHSSGGSGLGLAIARQLVELMGGQLQINSEPGQGSTFFFELPLLKQGAHSA